MFCEIFRNAWAAWCAESCCSGACLHEHVVDVAVVTADELYDFVPPCASAGEANRGHHSFGAGADQPDLFDRRNCPHNHRSKLRLKLCGDAEAGPFGHNFFDLVEDLLVCVAEYHRPP